MNETNYCLIVNDVQDTQMTDNAEVLNKILDMIDIAILDKAYICAVMINRFACGPIHPEIMKRVAGYKRFFTVRKPETEDRPAELNGARFIVAACKALKISVSYYRIVGYRTHYCVQSTVRGLTVANPGCRVDVIKDGCDDPAGNRWRSFPELPAVRCVYSNQLDSGVQTKARA